MMQALQQASKTQLDYCLKSLTGIATTWFETQVAARTSWEFDDAKVGEIADKLVKAFDDDIQHHAEKVIERGFNEGRLAARARFMKEDWALEGSEQVIPEMWKLIAAAGGEINREYFAEAITSPCPDLSYISMVAKWLECTDQIPGDVAEEINEHFGLEDEDCVGTFGQAAAAALSELVEHCRRVAEHNPNIETFEARVAKLREEFQAEFGV